jgi:hypothetical protein
MIDWIENGPTPTEISPNKKDFKRRKLILDNQGALRAIFCKNRPNDQ